MSMYPAVLLLPQNALSTEEITHTVKVQTEEITHAYSKGANYHLQLKPTQLLSTLSVSSNLPQAQCL